MRLLLAFAAAHGLHVGRAPAFRLGAAPRRCAHPRVALEYVAEPRPSFCLETATLLAGFAFESYNQPDVDWTLSPDGNTRTALLSPAFVREYYDGLVTVDAVKATLFRPGSMMPLQPLDTFIEVQATGGEVVRSEVQRGTESPEYLRDDPKFLYVKDSPDAALIVSVYYLSNQLVPGGDPKLLGRVQVPVRSLGGSIQLWGKQLSLSAGGGRLELKASYVPWSAQPDVGAVQKAATLDGLRSGALGDQLASAWGAWRTQNAVRSKTGASGDKRGATLGAEETNWLGMKEGPRGPRGGGVGVDWQELATTLGGAARGGGAFEACAFVENTRTSTQCSIFRQSESRTLVLSLRGTSDIRQVLTDVQLVQRPATLKLSEGGREAQRAEGERAAAATELADALEATLAALRAGDEAGALDELAPVAKAAKQLRAGRERIDKLASKVARRGRADGESAMVHSGFYSALHSVLAPVVKLTRMCVSGAAGSWTIYCTGHSLGGALATLLSWELEAVRASELPTVGEIATYSFGTPRVGNAAFARSFDASIPKAFRVVNGLDVVARVPRGQNMSVAGEWVQVGRTALIKPGEVKGAPLEQCGSDGLWVEGEDGGDCPLSVDATPGQKKVSASAGLTDAKFMFEGLAAGLTDAGFIVQELDNVRALVGGAAIAQHLEPDYYEGLAAAIDGWKRGGRRGPRIRGAPPALTAAPRPTKPPGADADAGAGADAAAVSDAAADAAIDAIDTVIAEELARASEAGERSGDQVDAEALLAVVQQRAAAAVNEFTGKDKYEFGDLSRAVAQRVSAIASVRMESGQWNMDDLGLLLRVLLLIGGELTPAASFLPVQMLLQYYGVGLAREVGTRALGEVSNQLAERVKRGVADSVSSVTGLEDYKFGDITRAAVSRYTRKEGYEFGDLTRATLRKLRGKG